VSALWHREKLAGLGSAFTCSFSLLFITLASSCVVLLLPPLVVLQGTKEFPQCGFSNNVVQILRALDAPFESVNILENEMLRSGMKEYSQWPT
jgi:monothiol glutaredoxin